MSNILKDEKKLDLVLERFYNRYNKYNEKVLKTLGETVKVIGDMKPSEVHQLSQQIKYSEDINKLIQELADITDLSSQDVETLFEKFAKENVEFAEAYYEAKDKEYKSYEDNIQLKRMVESIKHNTNSTMVNLSNASAIGFVYKDNFGNKSFKGLQKTYYDLIDEAVYQVATGTVDYGKAMRNVLNGLADSGIRTHEEKIGYKSGYSRRLDSAIRQNILDGLRSVNIDIQSQIGDEIGADGIEITAHTLCAPDHIPYQGRQYTKEEFEKINDYELDRPIATGMYNCRHFAMQVVLGVDEPMYSKEDLKRFEEESYSKVKYNGKTYTKYEATQIQRKLETAIRKQKDRQIVARASGDTDGIRIAQQKISQLTNEYNKFSNAVGLKTYKNKLTVSGYKRIKVADFEKNNNIDRFKITISKDDLKRRMDFRKNYLQEELKSAKEKLNRIPKESQKNSDVSFRKIYEKDIRKYQSEINKLDYDNLKEKEITLKSKNDCIDLLNEINIKLDKKNVDKIDLEVLKENTLNYYNLTKKYPYLEGLLQERDLKLVFDNLSGGLIGQAERSGRKIELDISNFNKKEDAVYWAKYQSTDGYNMPCSKDNYINYFATHEMGHTFNYRVIQNVEIEETKDLGAREFYEKTNEYFMDKIYKIAEKNTGKPKEELMSLMSGYGKSTIEEGMAELFANANCGKPNALGKAFDEYFKELTKI